MKKSLWIVVLSCGLSLIPPAAPSAAGNFNRLVSGAKQFGKVGSIRSMFSVPKSLAAPVHFWAQIYNTYNRNQVLIHDTDYLDIVYDVVDLSSISPLGDPFAPFPPDIQQARRDRVQAAMAGVREALLRLAAEERPHPQSPLEQRIVKLFAPHGASAAAFRAAATDDRLRSQTGLKDRFRAGVVASGRYLPKIQEIFAEEGVPWEISRLAFVESMFDLNAYSKAGASGIWQFMPGTARLMGMQNNGIIDERNDPIAASRGAARLLRRNYDDLGTWPLAINAYNSGPGRLRQAVRQLGTTSIDRIILNFRTPGYGFASRNFYCEFLAALHTYEQRDKHFGKLTLDPPLRFDTIVTTTPLRLNDLAAQARVQLSALIALNPGFASTILSGAVVLPSGYTLKVPPDQGRTFMAAMSYLATAVAGGGSGG